MSDESGSPRDEKRAPVKLKIKFRSATLTQFIERYSVDVSKGGIFIRTKDPLEVGTKLRFEFQLQDGSPLIVGEGTVVWIREHDPSRKGVAPGMGVRFDQLQPESKDVLTEILNRKSGAAPVMSDAEVVKKATAQAGRPDAPLTAPSPAAPALTPPKAAGKPAARPPLVPPVLAPVKAEDKPEEKAEDKPEEKAEDEPEEKAGDEPEEKAGDEPEEKAGDEPEEEAGDEPEEKAEDEPEEKAEDKPEEKAGDEPEEKAGDEPEEKAEDKPAKEPVEPPEKAAPKPATKPPGPVAKDRPVSASQDAARGEKSGGGFLRYLVILLIIGGLGAGAWVLFTQVLTDKTSRGQRGGGSGATAMGPDTLDAEAMRPVVEADAAVEAMRPEPVMQAVPECTDGILAEVTSEPVGGKIFLGKKDTGQVTPGKICIPKNRKKKVLRVDLDMYRPGYLYFRRVKDNKLDKIVLKPITYRVVIKTKPKRARVYLNDKYAGQTTLSIKLDPALTTLKLKISKNNYESREINLERANIKWRKQSRYSFVYPVVARLKRLYIPGDRTMDRPRPMDVEPMDADPMDADPMDAMRPEPMRVEPRRVEPRRVEPRRVEPRRVEPRRPAMRPPAAAAP